MSAFDVIVVGAGPVGLSLALGLVRRGRRVLVLEREPGLAEHSRAPAIWPKTQEILADLGLMDKFLHDGLTLDHLRLQDVERNATLFSAPLAQLADATDYPQLLILPQSQTEHLLLDSLQGEPNAEVRFGHEVTALQTHKDSVTVQVRINGSEPTEEGSAATSTTSMRARFVAGCDGARSAVREAMGATFPGITYKMRAALADVRIADSADLPFPRLAMGPPFAVGIRMGDDLWRMILPFRETDDMPLKQRVDAAADGLFAGRSFELVWQSEFRLHQRLSSQFASGPVVLAGDAAHLNSPVGGQGMNAGIQDSALLAERLVAALEKDSNEPLAAYATQRRGEIEQGVNRFTDILTRVLLAGNGRLLRPALRSMNVAMRIPFVRRRFLRRLAMLNG